MYGDLQGIAVYRVNPAAQVVVSAGSSNSVEFAVPGADPTQDVAISCSPVMGMGSMALSQPYVSGAGFVSVDVHDAADGDGGTITTSFKFDIVLGRARTKNSGAF